MSLTIEGIEPEVVRVRLRSWQGRLAGYEVSAYLVDGVLIDTGYPHARRELLRAIDVMAPRGVVVTHWHEDHAGNVPALATRGVPMHMHPGCEAKLRERPSIRLYRHFTWGRPPRLTAPIRPFEPAPLRVLHLPGHTADHLAVWDAKRRILVSGDLFLGVKVRIAHPSESPVRLVTSLRRAAALEPRLLLDAHRGVLRDPVPLLLAKIAWLEQTIDEIGALHARGLSDRAIGRRVFGREPLVGVVSRGEYSKLALVRAALRDLAAAHGA